MSGGPKGDWRLIEQRRQTLCHRLHRAAALDLAAAPTVWEALPTDGPVDDLLAARHASDVPSIHLSRTAGRLAVAAILWEIDRRMGGGRPFRESITALGRVVPQIASRDLPGYAPHLAELLQVAGELRALSDRELARVAGRAYEHAISSIWLFRAAGEPPVRLWDPWKAKQAGVFFTPDFVAAHLAEQAIRDAPETILDPAVGGGALLVQVIERLLELGERAALDRVYGVDQDPALVELSALLACFRAKQPLDEVKRRLRRQFRVGDSLLTALDLGTGPTWRSWFPEVFERGGFGAVVMNPPYLQLKVNGSSLPPRPHDGSAAVRARKRALGQAKRQADALAAALRQHPDFAAAHGGVADLPRYFIERALTVLRPSGRLSCIVPSTFLADHRSRRLRTHLLNQHAVEEIDLIPEDVRLFAEVNQPTCLVNVRRAGETRAVRVRAGVRAPEHLERRPAVVPFRLIETVDPEHLRIAGTSPNDWRILSKLHAHSRVADCPWIENLRGELDLTLDREFIADSDTGIRLVRGDQVERYTSDLPSEKPTWVDPRFLRESVSHRKLAHVELSRIVGRQCSYLKKPRRLSFSLVPRHVVVANSCNYLAVAPRAEGEEAADSQWFVLAILNSSVIEWRFRLTSSTNHVGNYEIATLPLPDASRSDAAALATMANALLEDPSRGDVDRQIDDTVFELFELSTSARRHIEVALARRVRA